MLGSLIANIHQNFYVDTGKADFIGFNYYTSMFAEPNKTTGPVSFNNDVAVSFTINPNWPVASAWLYSVPQGLRAMLKYV